MQWICFYSDAQIIKNALVEQEVSYHLPRDMSQIFHYGQM